MSKEGPPTIFIGYVQLQSKTEPCQNCPAKGTMLGQTACLPAFKHHFPGRAQILGISETVWKGNFPPGCLNKFKNNTTASGNPKIA